jgi:erythrin-vacuolar iron transport family protein
LNKCICPRIPAFFDLEQLSEIADNPDVFGEKGALKMARSTEFQEQALESHAGEDDLHEPVDESIPAQTAPTASAAERTLEHTFVLQKVQPALLGLMDGSVSTLAPIFAVAGLTGKPIDAFYVGLAASVGAGISMGLAEALSDDGKVSGRGGPVARGAITGLATVLGGMLHTLPFLLTDLRVALWTAYAVVIFELLAIAWIRFRFMQSPLGPTILQVVVGGGIVFAVGVWLGKLGAE